MGIEAYEEAWSGGIGKRILRAADLDPLKGTRKVRGREKGGEGGGIRVKP